MGSRVREGSAAVATRRVATRLTDEDVGALERLARAEDRTVSAMIRRLVTEGIGRRLGTDSEHPHGASALAHSLGLGEGYASSPDARTRRLEQSQRGASA